MYNILLFLIRSNLIIKDSSARKLDFDNTFYGKIGINYFSVI